MKKLILSVAMVAMLGVISSKANQAGISTSSEGMSETYSQAISVPTGTYVCGSNWIRVYEDSVKIVVDGDSFNSGFTVERDPWGNYVLKLHKGGCITIYSDRTALYYNDSKYEKKA